jgi:tRNA nucleotidyltransferase (CCA-adding enzyme)
MKIYLVGGAVRDELLGLPIRERDWVVVGAMPDDLLQQNFKQVGRDFPVFLHPGSKEEYALARTERKSAPGYYGFDCNYSASVTLEEDLARRDLTINAMAMDDQGKLIDPYGGKQDLEQKILRHVSPAFVEDPVRVLRLARFAARFHSLGFTLADETRQLIYSMVQSGELTNLIPERVWQEWQRSLEEKNPEQFILVLRACGALDLILPEIQALFGVPNPYKYHKEVDSGIHSIEVLQKAVLLSDSPVIRFAALVHDLGKGQSPMAHWPHHHGHEEAGAVIIEKLCDRLRIPTEYRNLAVLDARHHLTIHRFKELNPKTIVSLFEKTDAFRRPQLFTNLLLACEADASSRDGSNSKKWQQLLAACATIDMQAILSKGLSGKQIKEALHNQRIDCVRSILTTWKMDEK